MCCSVELGDIGHDFTSKLIRVYMISNKIYENNEFQITSVHYLKFLK